MRIGILSDTHNDLANLTAALKLFAREEVSILVHCGDLTTPETARALAGNQVIHVLGNGDYAAPELREALLAGHPDSWSGPIYTGELGGRRIAAAHGHERPMFDALVSSGRYEFILTGHTHRRRDIVWNGARVINPGSLGGLYRESRSICILDLNSDDAQFIEVSP